MSGTPRVSIILPTYNRAHLLGHAIDSVLQQVYPDFELIIIDDGSTDTTQELLAGYQDERIIKLKQKQTGRSVARNLGLSKARGEYIAFLDSDDLYLPMKLMRQVRFMDENPEFGALYASATCVDENGNYLNHRYRATVSGDIYAHVAFFSPVTITLPTVILRREVLKHVGQFDESLHRFEDTDMWRRVAKVCRFGALDEDMCLLRTHSDNHLISQDPMQIVTSIESYIAKVVAEDSDVDPAILQAGAARLMRNYGFGLCQHGPFATFGNQLKERASRYFRPLVSIIIPVYNGADFLEEAIDSALAQTYPNIEVIVINDGSSDGGATETIARGYGNRIRYYAKTNGGVASALNLGVEVMKGEYFSWLSHDDLYLPDKVASQIDFLVSEPDPTEVILYTDFCVFSHSRHEAVPVTSAHVEPENFRYALTERSFVHGCTLLIPKSAFERHGRFDESLRTTQDYDMWFRMASTHRFIKSHGANVLGRQHAGQGTYSFGDLVTLECNELLSRFVVALTDEQLSRGSGKGQTAALLALAESLAARGLLNAARTASRRAAELGRRSVGLLLEGQADASEKKRAADNLASVIEALNVRVNVRCDELHRAAADEIRQFSEQLRNQAGGNSQAIGRSVGSAAVRGQDGLSGPATLSQWLPRMRRYIRRRASRLPEPVKKPVRRLRNLIRG